MVSFASTMDDQSCPRCLTTKYRNPKLKLMVNVCGHKLYVVCEGKPQITHTLTCHCILYPSPLPRLRTSDMPYPQGNAEFD